MAPPKRGRGEQEGTHVAPLAFLFLPPFGRDEPMSLPRVKTRPRLSRRLLVGVAVLLAAALTGWAVWSIQSPAPPRSRFVPGQRLVYELHQVCVSDSDP